MKIFLKVADILKYIESNFPKTDENQTTLDQLVWFCCCREADAILSAGTTKDVAHMFFEGIVPYKINPEQSCQEWLDTIYADMVETDDVVVVTDGEITDEVVDEYAVGNVERWLWEHFNPKKASELFPDADDDFFDDMNDD